MDEKEEMGDLEQLISQSLVSKAFNMFLRTENGLNTALIKMFENYVDIGEGVVIDLDDQLKSLTDDHKYIVFVGEDYAFHTSPITKNDIIDKDGNDIPVEQGEIISLGFFDENDDDDFEDED